MLFKDFLFFVCHSVSSPCVLSLVFGLLVLLPLRVLLIRRGLPVSVRGIGLPHFLLLLEVIHPLQLAGLSDLEPTPHVVIFVILTLFCEYVCDVPAFLLAFLDIFFFSEKSSEIIPGKVFSFFSFPWSRDTFLFLSLPCVYLCLFLGIYFLFKTFIKFSVLLTFFEDRFLTFVLVTGLLFVFSGFVFSFLSLSRLSFFSCTGSCSSHGSRPFPKSQSDFSLKTLW